VVARGGEGCPSAGSFQVWENHDGRVHFDSFPTSFFLSFWVSAIARPCVPKP